jgi:hypothetical protein
MHFRGLDLNLLVALEALITEKSISRTGEKFTLANPAPAERNQELRGRTISMRNYIRLGHVVVRFGEPQEVPAFEEKFMEHFSEARRIEVVTTGFTLVPQRSWALRVLQQSTAGSRNSTRSSYR